MRLSVSQIKTFNASKATWAGKYLLGIKDTFESDALPLGRLFENYLITGKDEYDKCFEGDEIQDLEKLMQEYDALKHNSKGLEFEPGELQCRIEGELLGYEFIGYADNVTKNSVDDIKTTRYLTKEDSNQQNFWSGMSTYEEYELQLWAYMKTLGKKQGRILEIAKHRYKDDRNAHQVLTFDRSDEWDKKMTEKYKPLVNEMFTLTNKYAGNPMSSNK